MSQREVVILLPGNSHTFPIEPEHETDIGKLLREGMLAEKAAVCEWRGMVFLNRAVLGFYFRDRPPERPEYIDYVRRMTEAIEKDVGSGEGWKD